MAYVDDLTARYETSVEVGSVRSGAVTTSTTSGEDAARRAGREERLAGRSGWTVTPSSAWRNGS
jgi:hypothetical protein